MTQLRLKITSYINKYRDSLIKKENIQLQKNPTALIYRNTPAYRNTSRKSCSEKLPFFFHVQRPTSKEK